MTLRTQLDRITGRAAWFGGEPDPRVLQVAFYLFLHLALLGTQSVHLKFEDPGLWALRLCALALVITVVATPRVRDRRTLTHRLCYVDLALIGISALEQDVGTLPLVVLPAIWLARSLGWTSLWRVGLATSALVSLPGTLVHGNDDGTAVQLLALPFIAVMAAMSIAVGLDAARSAQQEAERQRAEADCRRAEAEEALAALAEQRRATDAIVETVGVGLVLLDLAGNVLLRNERQRQIDAVKYPEGRGQGMPLQTYHQDGVTPIPVLSLPSTVAARGAEFDDFRIWIGDNPRSRQALAVSARQLRDEEGNRTGSVLAYQDITDLMRALKVRDEFIALVSHELRTPLTSISGYVSMLEDRPDLPAAVTRQVQAIARNTDRLERLVEDLLQAAQVAAGTLRINRQPADLVKLTRDAVEDAAVKAQQAGVELTADLPRSLVLEIDPSRMAQVLDNLVSNAIKYTPPGGWARVELHALSGRAELRVADSGIGIRSGDLGELFSNFFRTEEASERAIQGAGLGLSISRTIVERHGGRIDVASRPGHGSVFTVVLPLESQVEALAGVVS